MLDHSLMNTRAGLAETRRALKDLRSKQLVDLGLSMAITNLATEAGSRGNFKLSLNITDNLPDLTPDIEQSIYRIAQESLENIIKHASAKSVELSLENDHQHLMLSITDDGSGFDTQNIDLQDKLGIQGMRERAAIIRSEFSILSNLNGGTTIRLMIPILWTTNT
jgi:two-component system sensor histidine kinase UhpB